METESSEDSSSCMDTEGTLVDQEKFLLACEEENVEVIVELIESIESTSLSSTTSFNNLNKRRSKQLSSFYKRSAK